ncbi:MAG TPA: trypsin-like peptidase domain-containing protein [Anaerolineales bacterium]|nr:trypsin-like peptidase domain-containing protein [Anaerolineales bacterium]
MSTQANNPLASLSEALAEAVKRAGAWTVTVEARRRIPASGIAYAGDLILTAEHVVERDEDITVRLPDGSSQAARVAGRDAGRDLALLRLESAALAPAEIASEAAQVGQLVLGLGRPSREVGIEASLGIISAIGGPARTGRGGLLESYLRTDTTPYPGFSGGPLVNTAGKLVGLNTSGLSRGSALTIPASLAWEVAATLAEHGHIRRGYLGVRSQPVEITPAQQTVLGRTQASGLLLVWIEEGGPAAQGGLLVGDILAGLGEETVSDHDSLLAGLAGSRVGQAVDVRILRGGQPLTLQVVVGERS